MQFKNTKGQEVNIVDFYQSYMDGKREEFTVHIGTDSVSAKDVLYVTTIAFRLPNRGAKVLTSRIVDKKIDKRARLWKEAEITIEFAEKLTALGVLVDFVEFDYNKDVKALSNELIPSAKGWAEALGYNVLLKPDQQVAVRYSDHVCVIHKKDRIHRKKSKKNKQ